MQYLCIDSPAMVHFSNEKVGKKLGEMSSKPFCKQDGQSSRRELAIRTAQVFQAIVPRSAPNKWHDHWPGRPELSLDRRILPARFAH
jgi:hypothetical protein